VLPREIGGLRRDAQGVVVALGDHVRIAERNGGEAEVGHHTKGETLICDPLKQWGRIVGAAGQGVRLTEERGDAMEPGRLKIRGAADVQSTLQCDGRLADLALAEADQAKPDDRVDQAEDVPNVFGDPDRLLAVSEAIGEFSQFGQAPG